MGTKRKPDQSLNYPSKNKKTSTSPTDPNTTALIRSTILSILSKRQLNGTCCPSEISRQCFPDDWRDWMQPTRDVALTMMKEGVLEITQKGKPIDLLKPIIGPCRLRLKIVGEKNC